jgi:hypothetical protein
LHVYSREGFKSFKLPIVAPEQDVSGRKCVRETNSNHGGEIMPEKKHLKGVSDKEQRQYEHIKESAEREGRYGKRAKEVAARTVMKEEGSRERALVECPKPKTLEMGGSLWPSKKTLREQNSQGI